MTPDEIIDKLEDENITLKSELKNKTDKYNALFFLLQELKQSLEIAVVKSPDNIELKNLLIYLKDFSKDNRIFF